MRALSAAVAALALLFVAACSGRGDGGSALPPETRPISRPGVGYGVVSVPHARLGAEPSSAAAAAGHARMGDVLRVSERRVVREGAGSAAWLLAEGEESGWIREELVHVYDNEQQARSAARSMR